MSKPHRLTCDLSFGLPQKYVLSFLCLDVSTCWIPKGQPRFPLVPSSEGQYVRVWSRPGPPLSHGDEPFPLQAMWEQCQLLKTASVFARCHPLVDPEPFVALCEKTLCTCVTGPECACPVLLEYARTCAQEGMVLYGWTDHSACRKLLVSPVLEQTVCLGAGVLRVLWSPVVMCASHRCHQPVSTEP